MLLSLIIGCRLPEGLSMSPDRWLDPNRWQNKVDDVNDVNDVNDVSDVSDVNDVNDVNDVSVSVNEVPKLNV